MDETINTHLNARPTDTVLVGVDPVAVDLSLLDTHSSNVACGLHLRK